MREYHGTELAYILASLIVFFLSLKWQQNLMVISLIMAFLPILWAAFHDLKERKITTDVFLILATAIGIFAHQVQAITVVLIIMLFAKYAESLIQQKTGLAVASLIKLIPTQVTIKEGNQDSLIDIHQLKTGMQAVIKTGEQIPADGVIIDGEASINESFLTGESAPLEKGKGIKVFAGTFVDAGAIVIRVQEIGAGTQFGRISKLLEQAEADKAKIITVSNRAAFYFVPILLAFIAIVWIATGDLTLVATLLVFGSPIELTLVTPLAVLAATAASFRHGILVKGSRALEGLSRVDTMVFDKTGTLTMGQPKVVRIEPLGSEPKEDILLLAAIIEKRSGHVLAKAIMDEAHYLGLTIPEPQSYESITGHGIIATYNNERYLLGSEHFIEAPEHGNVFIPESMRKKGEGRVDSYFYLSRGQKLLGRIVLADTVRQEANNIIAELKGLGIKRMVLLSGDRAQVAEEVARSLGIGEYYGEVDPALKLTMIKEMQKKGHVVAMVGDGINDAPALSQADIGIAMGAMGMEPAILAADVVLMSNHLGGLVFIFALSRKVMRLIKQNIFIGFAVIHFFGIALAMMHLITPIQAALFHAISDLVILANSARLIRFKG